MNPTMAEFSNQAHERFKIFLRDLPLHERAAFEQGIAAQREASSVDGLPQWNEDHLVGFLFATTMLRLGIQNAHALGQVGHDAMEMMERITEFNEHHLVALVRGV